MRNRPGRKRNALLALAAVLALAAISARTLFAQTALFIHDGPAGSSEGFKTASYVQKLLSHFSLRPGTLIPVDEYHAGQAASADYVFIIFEEGTLDVPEVLLDDLTRSQNMIVWINLHIEKLLHRDPAYWGLTHLGLDFSGRFRVMYKGRKFDKEDPEFNVIRIDAPDRVRVMAHLTDTTGMTRRPYVLRSRHLWYVADAPYSYAREGGRYLVLADVLHDVFGRDHPAAQEALLRIEDITPEDDPDALRRIADFLSGEKVPFQVSLVPRFKDPGSQVEVGLSDRPELAAAVRYMVSRGGTVVLHGVTHQHRGVSTDDFEFWDDVSGEPLSWDSPDWIRQRLGQGLGECFRNGLYPLAWETPHYSASRNTYRVIAEIFDTFNDRLMAADLSGAQVMSPFPFVDPELGVTIIPENLGYVDFANPDPERILRHAEDLRTVRDGTASFFFHPFVPLRHLKRLVRGMKGQGWRFVSLRDFDCNLRTPSQWVTSASGRGSITAANQYIRETTWGREGRLLRRTVEPSRQKGVVSRRVEVPAGGFYVLETLDLLPEQTPLAGPRWTEGLRRSVSEAGKEAGGPELRLTRAGLVTAPSLTREEDLNQRSYQSVFRYFGIIAVPVQSTQVRRDDLRRFDVLIVPQPAVRHLERDAVNALLKFLEDGGTLIIEGRSELAEILGFRFEGRAIRVQDVKEHSLPGRPLRWNPAVETPVFSSEGVEILADGGNGAAPLACLKKVGRGRVLFLAVPFDEQGPFGISRFAYFPHYLKNSLSLPFHVRRNHMEYYFDPGQRPFAGWEKLVKQWKAAGVKSVYLAAWHFYRNWTFNYRYFLRLCHTYGLAVYAWFEFPQVTPLMWEEHPEWREKTATGGDGLCHWRLQMNLFNPQAREEARDFMRKILLDFEWDGVNLAEFNFDTNQGASDPSKFVPLNVDVRAAFKKEAGFDPLEFFDPGSPRHHRSSPREWQAFLRFRTRITADWHADFLEVIEHVRRSKNRDMEVIVTVMDSLHHPEIIEECGVDTRDVLRLMERYDFTLQVEDPSRSWTAAPDRYVALAATYLEHIRDPERLMFDINVVPRRGYEHASLPAASATGTELAATVFFASLPSGRAAIYSESTVHPLDMDLLPFVMGSDVDIEPSGEDYVLKAKKPFQLFWNGPDIRPQLDGRPWPFSYKSSLSVPAGSHRLSFASKNPISFQGLEHRILLDADIRDLEIENSVIGLTYHSAFAAPLSFNRPPERIELDGRDVPFGGEDLNVLLPRGRHRLTLVLRSPVFQRLDEVGYASSSVFALIGLAAALTLAAFYVHVRRTR